MAIRCARFDGAGGMAILDGIADAVPALAQPDGFVWFDVQNPDARELSQVGERLGLHPLSLDDCLDEDQIPKLDAFPNYSFLLFNEYRLSGGSLQIGEVNVMLGDRFVVTVHGRGAADGAWTIVDQRIQRTMGSVQQGPAFLMHAVLDVLVDGKFEVIESLQERVDAAEAAVLRGADPFEPKDVLDIRSQLLELRHSLYYEREVLTKLCRHDSPFVPEKAIYPLRDVYDHLAKLFEVLEISREMISNLMDLHFAIQNNQLTAIANRTNHIMSRLSIIMTVFMPLTLLAGIGGMSEWTMMTGQQNWPLAYAIFVAAMAAIGVLNFLVLRWLKWV
jgi:magnesium transporter